MKFLPTILALIALALAHAVPCGAATVDDQARFLAGLSVEATDLEPLAREGAWQQHATEFHRAWVDLEERQLSKIGAWMPSSVNYAYADPSPLYYMFSGPDFLYAHAFFPNASTYVMSGREPIGTVPDVAALSAGARSGGLRNLRTALNAILSFSFFITADMKTDLSQTQLSGTLPVLYVFLARSGCHIDSVELVKLNAAGEFTAEKSNTPGVRIRFTGTAGQPQTLYYFTTDLSDWGIKSNPGFMAFCAKQGEGNGFVKAASYLMHGENFVKVRNFLLNNTRNLIEDDSGVPYGYFHSDQWVVSLFGHYPGPINLFKNHFQKDLDAAFKTHGSQKLPFGVGYQWRPGVSSLIVATALKSVPKAEPVAQQ
ncbi:MAG: hypothetical protein U0984_05975 [Prosthecobacter sp.]|nr:hypothetical protein [Prosthecobacter sp.]